MRISDWSSDVCSSDLSPQERPESQAIEDPATPTIDWPQNSTRTIHRRRATPSAEIPHQISELAALCTGWRRKGNKRRQSGGILRCAGALYRAAAMCWAEAELAYAAPFSGRKRSHESRAGKGG